MDHTLLTPTATWDQVKTVCDEGLTCRTASVCIPPRYVKRAAAYVGNQLKIWHRGGFPNGYSTPEVKVFEDRGRHPRGADEIDRWLSWAWRMTATGRGAGGDQGGQSIL